VKIFASWALTTPSTLLANVVVHAESGRISEVVDGHPRDADYVVDFLTPGYANCHSHAFHRGLRGRMMGTHHDFWSWRRAMYAFADRLDPDRYQAFATLVFREMVLAGFTSVGEFHYLHRDRNGVSYSDPNAMGVALIEAAHEAGIRLGLIDVCYLYGGLDAGGYRPLEGVQRRFGDQDVDGYLDRVGQLVESDRVRIVRGAHSLRAVTVDELARIVGVNGSRPWHLHLMEQPKEVEALQGHYGERPLALLAAQGMLSSTTTLVHLNQLSYRNDQVEAEILANTGAVTCACPTTEENLADGLSVGGYLLTHGARVSIGTDQHVSIDPYVETTRVDAHERLRTLDRSSVATSSLWSTLFGHDTIGFSGAGRLEPGALADMVGIDLEEPGIAGADPYEVLRVGTRASIAKVWVGGELVVTDAARERRALGAQLRSMIETLWRQQQ